MKKLTSFLCVIGAKIACAVLMAAMHVVLFSGNACLWLLTRLGRFGSRLASWTIAAAAFGKRHC